MKSYCIVFIRKIDEIWRVIIGESIGMVTEDTFFYIDL
jgi:hypothetical protein